MMMLLFLLLFYPRNLPLKFSRHQVSNRLNIIFVVVIVVVVIVHMLVVTFIVDFTKSVQEKLIY